MRELTDALRARNWSGIIAFETRNDSVEAGVNHLRAMRDAEASRDLVATVGA
ncbi:MULTISPECIES: hypothetical protein [unclassified Streptomyces]|uniref:hypothetical protein n=1 Tax=unclassified Streptomyces TaxID=2593676 RepID=UPI0035DEC2E0